MSKTYCFFSAQYLPTTGGVERFTHNLCKTLVKNGDKAIIITSQRYNLDEFENENGILIYRVPVFEIMGGRFPVIKFFSKKTKDIIKLIKTLDIDYFVVNTRFYPQSLVGVKLAKKLKKPCIVVEHGSGHLTVNSKLINLCMNMYEHIFTVFIKRNCNHFYSVAKKAGNWLKHFNINCEGVVYNSINPADIAQISDDLFDLSQVGVPKDNFIITYAGRFVKEKGVLELIEAFKKLNAENNNTSLVMAGIGTLYSEIKQANTKNVHVIGDLAHNELMSLCKQSDVFCLPSYSEGFATCLLEAAACKCYIVATDVGGAKELIPNDEYGCVINDHTKESIYAGIKLAYENRQTNHIACNKLYSYLCENFTWDITAIKLGEIFKSL